MICYTLNTFGGKQLIGGLHYLFESLVMVIMVTMYYTLVCSVKCAVIRLYSFCLCPCYCFTE